MYWEGAQRPINCFAKNKNQNLKQAIYLSALVLRPGIVLMINVLYREKLTTNFSAIIIIKATKGMEIPIRKKAGSCVRIYEDWQDKIYLECEIT